MPNATIAFIKSCQLVRKRKRKRAKAIAIARAGKGKGKGKGKESIALKVLGKCENVC